MKKIIFAFLFFTGMNNLKAQDVSKEIKSEPIRWGIANNFSLKGDIGQLVINLPVQSTLKCLVNRTGETKALSLQANTAKDLLPGKYDILFQGIKIPLVDVEKGKETRILAGILNSTVKGLWEVWTTDSVKIFSAGSPKLVALPVGNYIVKTQGVELKTTIRDGKISMFSYTKY